MDDDEAMHPRRNAINVIQAEGIADRFVRTIVDTDERALEERGM